MSDYEERVLNLQKEYTRRHGDLGYGSAEWTAAIAALCTKVAAERDEPLLLRLQAAEAALLEITKCRDEFASAHVRGIARHGLGLPARREPQSRGGVAMEGEDRIAAVRDEWRAALRECNRKRIEAEETIKDLECQDKLRVLGIASWKSRASAAESALAEAREALRKIAGGHCPGSMIDDATQAEAQRRFHMSFSAWMQETARTALATEAGRTPEEKTDG